MAERVLLRAVTEDDVPALTAMFVEVVDRDCPVIPPEALAGRARSGLLVRMAGG